MKLRSEDKEDKEGYCPLSPASSPYLLFLLLYLLLYLLFYLLSPISSYPISSFLSPLSAL